MLGSAALVRLELWVVDAPGIRYAKPFPVLDPVVAVEVTWTGMSRLWVIEPEIPVTVRMN
jgi:hypothetical protein